MYLDNPLIPLEIRKSAADAALAYIETRCAARVALRLAQGPGDRDIVNARSAWAQEAKTRADAALAALVQASPDLLHRI